MSKKTISKIAVVGAGNMGSGIAQKIAQEQIGVTMLDTKKEFAERGMSAIKKLLGEAVDRKIFKPEQAGQILSRIKVSADLSDAADADIVVEAVFEDKQVKTDLFEKLDKICSKDTIFATNTSSFYVRDFAKKTSRPDRFIGCHYFFHPAKNRLLEVIPHDGTSRETLEKTLLFAKLHGKTAIVVRDTPGFAVNRFFVPFLNEAARLLEEGVANIPTIEKAAKKGFKIGMGPFTLMNITGIPIAVHSATTLGKELGAFYAPAEILKTQMEKRENWDLEGDADESKFEAVIDRLSGVCLGVAATLADEGVASVEDIDRGAKIGLRWALGPFEIMNRIGIGKAYETVGRIVKKYDDFRMPELLEKQNRTGRPFAFKFVDFEVKDEIGRITLNRPEAMNALNETMFVQINEQFTLAEKNPDVKAVVLQGAGKAFVAGADIRYFVEKIRTGKIPEIVEFTRKAHELLMRIENSDKLTIAILDGLSLGGGSELALACQAIVATPAGSIGFPETGIGIFPGLGGMFRFAKHAGPELAKYYIFTGKSLNAEKLAELGIVTTLADPAEVESAVKSLAEEGAPDKYRPREIPESQKILAQIFTDPDGRAPEGSDETLAKKAARTVAMKAPLAIKTANEIIDRQVGQPFSEAAEIELGRLAEIFSTGDALEGLSSLGKRKPEYRGK